MAEKVESKNIPTPKEIKEYLDRFVIGQDEAKKVLSVAVYNHYKRIYHNNKANVKFDFDKSNVIMAGDSGTGKTLLVKTIAKLLGVPYYIQDCTKITASGYVGCDVENCIVGLLRNCNYDLKLAEIGIVYLDECDKLAKCEIGPSITKDVSGECVQQSLLKIVEGDVVGVPPQGGRIHPEQGLIYVNTKNILFIASGAFVGLEDIVSKRFGQQKIGFENSQNNTEINDFNYGEYINAEDIKQFGFIPEFVGRFPVITATNKLTRENLRQILTEPENSIIKQYIAMLKMDNVKLNFTDEALDTIVDIAAKSSTGARSLRGIVEVVMLDVMYNVDYENTSSVIIDKDMILEKTKKKYQMAV